MRPIVRSGTALRAGGGAAQTAFGQVGTGLPTTRRQQPDVSDTSRVTGAANVGPGR